MCRFLTMQGMGTPSPHLAGGSTVPNRNYKQAVTTNTADESHKYVMWDKSDTTKCDCF